MEDNLTHLDPWEVIDFPWGTGVRHRKGRWTNIFIKPLGEGINVEHLNVVLHANGIEFIPEEGGQN
jgi:hypothetical protein